VRQETKDWLALIGKSILLVLGGILVLAALVDLAVGEPAFRRGEGALATFEQSPALVLLLGLALALPPLGLAFRDALREARKGRL
jgi:hypothetical protein